MSERSGRWYGRWWAVVLLLAMIFGGAGLLTVKALGLRSVSLDVEPFPLPPSGFDYTWWDSALRRWVRDDSVDYDAVRSEKEGLSRFIALLGAAGPESTPHRFSTEPERLAYYLNAYNALTLFGVVDNWPIESVHDVHGWLDPRAGFGFFYGLRFPLDGDETNLYDLENGVIRGFLDARIHAALNCASRSCPALAPYAFVGSKLDDQLDVLTQAFCSNAPHVSIDEEAREIRLSAIFDWYRPDFEEHARRLGREATVLDFVIAFARPEMSSRLERARTEDFEVVFQPYDWALNQLRGR